VGPTKGRSMEQGVNLTFSVLRMRSLIPDADRAMLALIALFVHKFDSVQLGASSVPK